MPFLSATHLEESCGVVRREKKNNDAHKHTVNKVGFNFFSHSCLRVKV